MPVTSVIWKCNPTGIANKLMLMHREDNADCSSYVFLQTPCLCYKDCHVVTQQSS